MPSKRKFHRTSFKFDVLSEEPIPDGVEFQDILRECDTGDYVLAGTSQEQEELDGPAMVKALEDAGSEESFFQLTPEGGDEGEEEDDFAKYKCHTGDESICEPCQTGVGECAHVAAARAAASSDDAPTTSPPTSSDDAPTTSPPTSSDDAATKALEDDRDGDYGPSAE